VRGQNSLQSAFSASTSAFATLVNLYDIDDVNERFMTSLSKSISRLVQGHSKNQKSFVEAGILDRLVSLSERQADKNVQLAAVNAFRDLVNGQFTVDKTCHVMCGQFTVDKTCHMMCGHGHKKLS